MLKRINDFILFGSIFISLCAVALCIETNLLLHLKLNSASFYFFVFGATLVQYNLHYLFKTKAVSNSQGFAWSQKNKLGHKILVAVGVVLILISLFSFRLHHFLILSILGAIAVLYSFPLLPFPTKKRIKDFGLLKIITLALLWTLVTVWFPVDEAKAFDLSFALIFIRRFIFIFILCLLFDIRDIEIDKRENISTIAVKLGAKASYKLCYTLLAVFVGFSAIQYFYLPDAKQLIVMLISAAATFAIIKFAEKHNNDVVYLAGIDGMMLLQALMVIFASLKNLN